MLEILLGVGKTLREKQRTKTRKSQKKKLKF